MIKSESTESSATGEPLVSILMTAFNREKYIAEAIESVLNSSYRNFELIIVDDHSTDDTVGIANRYALTDSRIRVYINNKNLGDYPNRNRAASYATGKYLKYVDSDDFIYPWGLQLLVSMIERFPRSGWGLCSLLQDVAKPFPLELTPKEAYEYHYLGPGLFHKAPLSSIIRKNVFDAVGGFSPQRMVGDSEMWHKLAQKYNVLLMPDGIVWSREHDAQEVNSRARFLIEYEKIIIHYLKNKNCPLDEETASRTLQKRRRYCGWEFFKAVIKLNPDLMRIHLERWKSYNAK